MSHKGTFFSNVVFDARTARFIGSAIVQGNSPQALPVSAPGHVTWSFNRITQALSEAFGRRKETLS